MPPDDVAAARAAALFTSDLSSHCRPSEAAVAAAIRKANAVYGGSRGCLGEVAAAYGERPETAAPRMRWARQTIDAIYSPAAARRGAHHPIRPVSRNGRAKQSAVAVLTSLTLFHLKPLVINFTSIPHDSQ